VEFLRHASAADHATPLENPHAQSRHTKIGRTGQAIVSGTHYDGINIGQGVAIWGQVKWRLEVVTMSGLGQEQTPQISFAIGRLST
jgi:hypothetical protein